ncbi:unnamed protein product, partial [Scytosiphon promiscuus]
VEEARRTEALKKAQEEQAMKAKASIDTAASAAAPSTKVDAKQAPGTAAAAEEANALPPLPPAPVLACAGAWLGARVCADPRP